MDAASSPSGTSMLTSPNACAASDSTAKMTSDAAMTAATARGGAAARRSGVAGAAARLDPRRGSHSRSPHSSSGSSTCASTMPTIGTRLSARLQASITSASTVNTAGPRFHSRIASAYQAPRARRARAVSPATVAARRSGAGAGGGLALPVMRNLPLSDAGDAVTPLRRDRRRAPSDRAAARPHRRRA